MALNVIESLNDLPDGVTFPNGMVAVDCEMMGLNVFRDRLCLVQMADGEGNVYLVKFDGQTWDAPNLKRILEDKRLLKIFHFGRYDLTSIRHYLGIHVSPVYDTKIASKLCRTYTDRHGFGSLVEEMLGEKLEKAQGSSNWGADELTEDQKHYAICDVIYLHDLKQKLDDQLKQVDRLHLAQQCFDFLPVRVDLDLEGWESHDIFAHH